MEDFQNPHTYTQGTFFYIFQNYEEFLMRQFALTFALHTFARAKTKPPSVSVGFLEVFQLIISNCFAFLYNINLTIM